MKYIDIIISNSNKKYLQEVSRDHYHYDSNSGQIQKLHGGKIDYIYDFYLKRSIPIISKNYEYKNKSETNLLNIKKWIKKYSVYFNINILDYNKNSISISVNDIDYNNVIDSLEENLIKYE